MALQTGQYLRGGLNGGVIDADGRRFAIGTGGVAATLVASNTVTSPGVVTITALVTPPVGIYSVETTIYLSGTAETALTNLRLRVNSATVGVIPSLPGMTQLRFPRVTVTAGSISVDAAVAGVVGSVYTVMIAATRVE